MLKVVIIDDEPLVLEGLKGMVDWEDYGFKVCGEALDGEEGYELIQTTNPDLVITDMRMPVMNGLELIERCHAMNMKAKFVILSGYSEFEYVKKALKFQTFQYLLKPIDNDEMHALLRDIKQCNLDEQAQKERIQKDIHFVLHTSLKRLVSGECKVSLCERIALILNLYHQHPLQLHYTLLWFQGENRTSRKEDVREVLEQILPSVGHPIQLVVFDLDDKSAGVLLYGMGMTNYTIQSIYKMFYDRWSLRDDQVIAFITGLKRTLAAFKFIDQEIERLKKVHFYEEHQKIIMCHQNTPIKYSQDISTIHMQPLLRDLPYVSKKTLDYQLIAMFNQIKEEKIEPSILNLWAAHIKETLLTLSHPMPCKSKDSISNRISNMPTVYTSYWTLKKDISHLIHLIHQQHEDEDDRIQRIKAYVNKHYDKDIKLKKLSKTFKGNSTYIGQRFQKEVGMKYNAYVLHVRLKKAKELLLYTNKNIKEVAFATGFNNPDYFVLKFKEAEGHSPTVFRNQNIEQRGGIR